MRELDELLLAYLEQRYDRASSEEKSAFRALLELPDEELMAYLLLDRPAESRVAIAVDAILHRDPP